MQIKEVNELSNRLSKKLSKSRISIITDIIKCKNKYKCDLGEYEFYEFYNLTDEERSTYLTKEKNNELISLYNSDEDKIILEDKGVLYKRFKEFLKRDYIDLREVSFKEFTNFIISKDKIICRNYKDNTYEILEIDKNKLKNEYNILKIYNNIMKKEEYIVEEMIYQNKSLSKLYSNRLNTIKITTLFNKDVNIINKVLIIGNKGETIKDGMLYAFINDDGKIKEAQDLKGHYYKEHPITFEKLEGFTVPYLEEAIICAKRIARQLETLKYITFEFAISEEGVKLIDASIPYEILQPRLSINKEKKGLLEKLEKGDIYER